MTRLARLAAILVMLAGIVSVSVLNVGAGINGPTATEPGNLPTLEADSGPSVTCTPFGLYGDITAPLVVDSLSKGGDNLVFLGTSNGLYVVGPDGKLRHFLYTPFGVRFVALIDDITGDGSREVVVALNDVQVPALRCYDGANWRKLWQFAPAVRVWDLRWVELQLGIADMEVRDAAESQSIVVAAGGCAFSIDTRNGAKQWEFQAPRALERVRAVADLNGDGVDEVFAGSEDGCLYLFDGQTGEARWQTRLPEQEDKDGNTYQSTASDFLAVDGQAGNVMVASTDGAVRMFNLNNRDIEWEAPVFDHRGDDAKLRMALAPHVTPGDQEKVVVLQGSDTVGYTTSPTDVALVDSAGTVMWTNTLPMWGHLAPEVGLLGGKAVILASAEQQITLIELADGESTAKSIRVDNLDKKPAIVRQLEEDRYLLVSSLGDMRTVSVSGETQWYYPRINHITAESGDFVGDGTKDVLFSCEWDSGVRDTTYSFQSGGIEIASRGSGGLQARSLHVMDGATRDIAWSYEISPAELIAIGGLKGVRLAPDLVGGDNVPDIISYRGDTAFVFSGKDGQLSRLTAGQAITSIDVLRNGAPGWAIAVGIADPSNTEYLQEYGLLAVDMAGKALWTTTYAEWKGDDIDSYCRGFTVLDDINSDNVSDLAIAYPTRIVILESTGGTATYTLSSTLLPDDGSALDHLETMPDADGDGIRELACFQEARRDYLRGESRESPPCPFLCVWSPEDGRSVFKTELLGQVLECSLGSCDFNGDGCADSILLIDFGGCGASSRMMGSEHHLQVISGRDGRLLWSRKHQLVTGGYSWGGIGSNPLPATGIRDADGDGAGHLALFMDGDYIDWDDYALSQRSLEIYDAAGNDPADVIPASPLLRRNQLQYQEKDETLLLADVDQDGHQEVIMSAGEPAIPYQPKSPNPFEDRKQFESRGLAVIDPDDSRHLTSFTGFTLAAVSVFETNQPDCLGVADRGCAYFMSLNSRLEVVSPADGARTDPTVKVTWEGANEGEFVQVFVDGVRNYSGNDSELRMSLGRGEHEIVVRSVDDYGRVSYGPSDLEAPLTIKVASSPWKPVWLLLSLFALLALALLLFLPRLRRVLRARRREAKT